MASKQSIKECLKKIVLELNFFSPVSEQNISVLTKQKSFTQWKKLSERIPEHENSLNLKSVVAHEKL